MQSWPDRRLLDLLNLELPIIQAPMSGVDSPAMAQSVSATGALGSLAAALLTPEEVREAAQAIREATDRPFNLNFFCHTMTPASNSAKKRWKTFLRPHYERFALDVDNVPETRLRLPFDEEMCAVVEDIKPTVVSFHFGLPDPALLHRLKQQGIKILSSATSVSEAKHLEDHGCDAIIVQGIEAGGHRAMFLETNVTTQPGLFALLPQVADAVFIPLIAAGGIADARGIVAALALGASGVQMGTAYLLCPEANVSPLYRQALQQATDTSTTITNLFSGRPARGLQNRFLWENGPLAETLPFPHAATWIAPLRAASEAAGSTDYMQMWAGQSAHLARPIPAAELTRTLATEALSLLHNI